MLGRPVRLLIATPFDGGDVLTARVTLGYHRFVRALERDLGADVLDGELLFAADVVRARNRAASHVLQRMPEISHVLWLDDDNFPEDVAQGLAVVHEMISSGEDLIAAPYTNKRPPLQWTHNGVQGVEPDERGVLDVLGVGFGFTITSRACLERMAWAAETYQDLPNQTTIANLFGQVYEQHPAGVALMSEDYSFCKRWRDLGGRVKIYLRAGIIQHVGSRAWSARDIPGAVLDSGPA